jgi:hypothetical protein
LCFLHQATNLEGSGVSLVHPMGLFAIVSMVWDAAEKVFTKAVCCRCYCCCC